MSLGPAILKILDKQYEPNSFVERRFQKYDLGFQTDDHGNPMVLFLGVKQDTGKIKGRRYARRLIKEDNGKTLKDHWDDKGPAL